ncbi:MAG TPA: protein kinase [Candidatus Limnocylindrales bacterium]|nr:protein kinase [Candidatus Limnocylindrales bacterium]
MAIQAPSSGRVLGHYRLIEQIGAGGMGVVFRARDEQLQRDVAVKILPAGLFADDATRKQFRKEALAVGKLNHPNIAMAFDFGEENGVDYLVTEYIPGLNLDEMLVQQALPQKTVLELGIQLASGLEAAHRENVIHRDLKPGNLRVNPDGQLKILDFGLAKLVEPIDEVAETANLNTSLSLSGTVPYMAPELLRAETADARSDIWAAGAVLYEMATGKRAFPDRQPSLLIDAILHYDPVRPCLLNPEVSAALETVILKALDREPDLRYQSARELRADLSRILAGDELSTETLRRTSFFEVERKARHRKAALILAAVLLAGVAVGYGAKRWWRTPSSNQQRIMAVLPFDTVGQDPATSALGLGLTETLTAKLVQASDTDAIQVVSPRDLRDQGVKTAEDARREFGTDFVLESSLQRSGQTIRVNCFLVDSKTHRQIAARSITVDAGDAFGLQDRVVSETLDMLPAQIKPERRRQLNAQHDTQPAAYEAYIRGRGYMQEPGPDNIEKAIAEFTKAIQIDPNYALGYAALGNSYWVGFQQYAKPNGWVPNASRNCQKALSVNPELVAGHVCLGRLLTGSGKYDQAVEEFQRAVRAEPGSEDALLGLAEAYSHLGDLAAAESTYKKAVALRPEYWGVYSWLGTFYFGQNRYADAAAAFLKSTQLAPNNYLGYFNLGGAYGLEGRYSEAIDALKRSIELRPSLDAYGNLGYTYTLMHRYPEAIAALEQALKIDDHDWLNWGNLGDALYWSPSRRAEAEAKYRKAIAIAASKLEVNAGDVPTLAYLADYSAMVGDRQTAITYIEKALKLAPSNGEALFRAALVYNHFNQTNQTLTYLTKAVEAGYSRTVVRDTPDFGNLQQHPMFRQLAATP